MLSGFSHFLPVALLLSLAVGAELPDPDESSTPNQACCPEHPQERLSPEVVLDKVARECGLNKAEFSIRYVAPYYIIEPNLSPDMVGGGLTLTVDPHTGRIIERSFTE